MQKMANEKRLIDPEQAYEIARLYHHDFGQSMADLTSLRELLEDCPTVDAVPVVHGRWERVIPTKSAAKWSTKVSCSVCHKQGYTHHKYCPNCGAHMRGDEHE